MAETSNLFETLKCIICLDFAEDAVETSCCHQVCCHDCGQPLEKCPTCEKMGFQLQPSIAIRRMIANLPDDCPYEKCGTKTTKGELKAHLEICLVKNQVPCPDKECDFADKAEVVAEHIIEQHPELSVECIAQNLNTQATTEREVQCFFPSCKIRCPKVQIWNHVQESHREDVTIFQDVKSLCIVSTKEPVKLKNDAGFPVKIGHNGKFYCGIENAVREGKHCIHPNDNCCACMKLDLMFRDLAPYQLVNKEGRACKTDPCNHCVGGYFSGQAKRPKMTIVDRMCQKSSCGNDPVFYCGRSRQISNHAARYHCDFCDRSRTHDRTRPLSAQSAIFGSGSYEFGGVSCNGIQTYGQEMKYCRRHDGEFCSACQDITGLMADPYLVYNTVWDS